MIILMGPVGSGKSEQSSRLAARLNIPVLSTSNLLREHLTPEREIRMRAGDLVDDKEIIGLVSAALGKLADGHEFLLDGFPRSIPQAEWLVSQVDSGQIDLKAIIKLQVPDEVVLERMLKRGRQDDKRNIIMHRLAAYHQTTTPVVDYLRKHGMQVNEINGQLPPSEVEALITKVLDSVV